MVVYRFLTSATSYVALSAKTAYTRISVGLSSARPYITTALGNFIITRFVADAVAALEQITLFFSKAPSDNVATTDLQVKSFSKAREDGVATNDTVIRGTSKSFAEALAGADVATKVAGKNNSEVVSATDISSKALNKNLLDSPSAADLLLKVMSFTRTFEDGSSAGDTAAKTFEKYVASAVQLNDTQAIDFQNLDLTKLFEDFVYATDDVNGASADDDQSIQFFKLRSDSAWTEDNIAIVSAFARVYSDEAYTSDVSTKAFASSREEQAVTSESGFVKSQGYCDIDYFMEDYVGATRTF